MTINTRYLFLDANVFNRYILQSKLSSLLEKINNHFPEIELITCTELINEIADTCTRERPLKTAISKGIHNYEELIAQQIEVLRFYSDIYIDSPIAIQEEQPVDDMKDWYIFNLGKQYNVTIVSGDKHIREIAEKPFPFIDADDFLNYIR
jgi:predicted nucleic acid-binding protein